MDAQHDFIRARRRATIAKLMARLRGEPGDVGVALPDEEVIDALGFVSEHRTRLHVVPLDAIVGSVDRGRVWVVAMLREAGLIGDRTDAEAYMRVAGERYWPLRTHEWSDVVLQHVIEGKGRWRPEG